MKKTCSFFLILLSLLIWAQQDIPIAFYGQNLQFFNPAATGLEDQVVMS